MTKITHIVIHYSATYGDLEMTRADIDKMHKERGWKGIGYHWFIRRDGTVEEGRPESQVGAHVGGQNAGKIGICWAGGLERATGPNKGVDNRTPAQTEALVHLIRACLKRYPGAKVVGHRDLAATQCPGFDVPVWWAKVQKVKQPTPKPVDPSAPAKTGNLSEDKIHVVEKGDTWFSIASMHGLSLNALLAMNDATANEVLVIGRNLLLRRPAPSAPAPKPNSDVAAGGIVALIIAGLTAAAAYLFN
ncbi:MAG: N-acetylmuramoyl-L-alanine amidase [Rhizobiaceae bacterium]|nr:N-acetylmuramoyl-L-alanine amidase [Rhizobiaceae bacterium]